jgi:hypothetical protein
MRKAGFYIGKAAEHAKTLFSFNARNTVAGLESGQLAMKWRTMSALLVMAAFCLVGLKKTDGQNGPEQANYPVSIQIEPAKVTAKERQAFDILVKLEQGWVKYANPI